MSRRSMHYLRGCYPRALRTTSAQHASSILPSRCRLPSTVRPIVFTQKKNWQSLQLRQFSASALHAAETKIICVPSMAESISEGVLSTFNRQVGDYVEQDEEVASIETDKIDVAVNAPQSGTITKLIVNEGDTVTVGQAVIEISLEERDTTSQSPLPPQAEQTSKTPQEATQKQQIPTREITPSQEPKKGTTPTPTPKTTPQPVPNSQGPVSAFQGSRSETKVKMSRMRLRTAERLKESQNTAAFLTTFNEVDMSKIMALRSQNKDDVLQKHGVKLGFMGPVARASALALREIPAINASIENDDTIVFHDYIDLSVAVATPKGLVTPVLRNMERQGIVEIEQGIAELGKKVNRSELLLAELYNQNLFSDVYHLLGSRWQVDYG
ncbi:dihydrolipoamide succinyltransferase [Aspergillus oryzae 100-8]|uniref:Dihydrolipoamide acetyltransferase component of pyruvate dehydrogenase complex n=1 Tax=Aspergillus oryzae (strain 3.042) TaxID=1160506 RepID=I8A5R8_ASPO3|nr:dihydrolipoamide succinyltransferase [Aspergillus oryzae 3.042]KDE81071.1 dihydrolipoamide succinyltransferase [Aspergillus oryzae 100-8]|eukprot:EIT79944.1 dihydrolipoamide succinyltransferase [Aspergillus oryzae 3.042]